MRRAILVLIPLMALIAIGGYRIGMRRAHGKLELDPDFIQDAFLNVDEIGASVREINTRIGVENQPLTIADETFLKQSQAQLLRLLRRKDFQSDKKLLAHAGLQLGHVDWLMDRREDALGSFLESLKLLDDLITPKSDWDLLLVKANVCASISCLMGELDEFSGAIKFAQVGLDASIKASDAAPDFMDSLWYQGILLRNLAIASQMEGINGADYAVESAALFADIFQLAPKSDKYRQAIALEGVVDAFIVLSAVYQHSGNDVLAREALQKASQKYDLLISTCQDLQEHDGDFIPWERFRRVENQFRGSSDSVSQFKMEKVTNSGRVQSGVRFVLLDRLSGTALHPELLVKGRVAAEFQPQKAIVLIWPEYQFAYAAMIEMIKAIQSHSSLIVLAQNSLMEFQARNVLREEGISLDQIQFIVATSETVWLRDFGPLAIQDLDGNPFYIDAKYNPVDGMQRYRCDHVPVIFEQTFEIPRVRIPIITEWGAVAFNGSDIAIVSEKLLQKNLKSGFSERSVTNTLKRLTGVESVVYLAPLEGEGTGHVDLFLTFTSPDTVVLGDYGNADFDNSQLLNQHAVTLSRVRRKTGRLNVVRIPMPPRQESWFGGSYTNVVYANDVLLVPSWPDTSRHELEQSAFDTYQQLLPNWQIVPINCERLGSHGGSLHCITINIPETIPVAID